MVLFFVLFCFKKRKITSVNYSMRKKMASSLIADGMVAMENYWLLLKKLTMKLHTTQQLHFWVEPRENLKHVSMQKVAHKCSWQPYSQ